MQSWDAVSFVLDDVMDRLLYPPPYIIWSLHFPAVQTGRICSAKVQTYVLNCPLLIVFGMKPKFLPQRGYMVGYSRCSQISICLPDVGYRLYRPIFQLFSGWIWYRQSNLGRNNGQASVSSSIHYLVSSFSSSEDIWLDTVDAPRFPFAFQTQEQSCSFEKTTPGLLANKYSSITQRRTDKICTYRESTSLH